MTQDSTLTISDLLNTSTSQMRSLIGTARTGPIKTYVFPATDEGESSSEVLLRFLRSSFAESLPQDDVLRRIGDFGLDPELFYVVQPAPGEAAVSGKAYIRLPVECCENLLLRRALLHSTLRYARSVNPEIDAAAMLAEIDRRDQISPVSLIGLRLKDGGLQIETYHDALKGYYPPGVMGKIVQEMIGGTFATTVREAIAATTGMGLKATHFSVNLAGAAPEVTLACEQPEAPCIPWWHLRAIAQRTGLSWDVDQTSPEPSLIVVRVTPEGVSDMLGEWALPKARKV